jgi:hypothetical protein
MFHNGPDNDVRIRINGEMIEPREFVRQRMPEMMRQFRWEGGGRRRAEIRRDRRITI